MDIRLSAGSSLVFSIAALEAAIGHCKELTPEHLFLAMCKVCDLEENEFDQIAAALQVCGKEAKGEVRALGDLLEQGNVDFTRTRRELRKLLQKESDLSGSFSGHRSESCRRVCRNAETRTAVMGEQRVLLSFFLWGILTEGSPLIREALGDAGRVWADLCRVCNVEPSSVSISSERQKESASESEQGQGPAKVEERAAAKNGKSRTPLLDKFGRDVTALARAGKLAPCIGRKEEMRLLAQILCRQTKSNPVLVGDPGVGKTCIVEGLAQRIVHPEAPETIRGWRIVEISMANLIAGCIYQGQFEQRLQTMIAEARSDPNLILFMDELHTVIGAGGSSDKGMDAGQILKPAMARGEIRLIGATTTAEYRKFIEPDGALERRFQVVWVNEPTREEAVEILEGLRPRLEQHHKVKLDPGVVEKAVEWSMRYLPDRRLPDKALDLIDQACAAKMIRTLSPVVVDGEEGLVVGDEQLERITEEDIAYVISERCRIPVGSIAIDEAAKLVELEEFLMRRVIGQDVAIKEVAEAIRTARVGLKKPNRPVGVFLFVGSTGTGKTELAKALAEFLFGTEDALIRFDMSEYGEKHNVARLIGAPPGYLGHDEEGQLTGKVRTRPFCVVLFDEIEKAHPDVFNIFLQIFDDGRLTDSKGRRTMFTESIMILTSNLGIASQVEVPRRGIGFDLGGDEGAAASGVRLEVYRRRIEEAVRQVFRPELLNRINHQVIFYPLTKEVVFQILDKLIEQLNRLLADKGVTVELSVEAKELLLAEGYSEAYGARELERAFERLLVTPLGMEILEKRIDRGARVHVVVRDGSLQFQCGDRPSHETF